MSDQHNPYSAGDAVPVDAADSAGLADRGTRLGAAIIDVIIMLAVTLPVMWVGGYFRTVMEKTAAGEQPSLAYVFMWSLIGLAIFAAIQFLPLSQSGQTWGKRMLGIRIADMAGNKPPIGTLLFRRYLPMQVAASIPYLGGLIGLANVLLIFRDDRRCGHDLVAGTQVLKGRV